MEYKLYYLSQSTKEIDEIVMSWSNEANVMAFHWDKYSKVYIRKYTEGTECKLQLLRAIRWRKIYNKIMYFFLNLILGPPLTLFQALHLVVKSRVMRKSAKDFNISWWLFFSLVAKSKVPIHTSYLPH